MVEDMTDETNLLDISEFRRLVIESLMNLPHGQWVEFRAFADVLLPKVALERWQQLHPAFEADIYDAIHPRQVVAARRSEGGTAFDQVRLQLQRAQARLTLEP